MTLQRSNGVLLPVGDKNLPSLEFLMRQRRHPERRLEHDLTPASNQRYGPQDQSLVPAQSMTSAHGDHAPSRIQASQSQIDAYKADADDRARHTYGQNLSHERSAQIATGQQTQPHIDPFSAPVDPQGQHDLALSHGPTHGVPPTPAEIKTCESQVATLLEYFEAGNDWPQIDGKLGVRPGVAKSFWVRHLKKDHPESQGARRKSLTAKASRRQNDRRKKATLANKGGGGQKEVWEAK